MANAANVRWLAGWILGLCLLVALIGIVGHTARAAEFVNESGWAVKMMFRPDEDTHELFCRIIVLEPGMGHEWPEQDGG